MGFTKVLRKVVRSVASTEQNDLVLATKKQGDDFKDLFKIGASVFTESKLDAKENAAFVAQDDETKEIYLVVTPFDGGDFLKARKSTGKAMEKSAEFGHKDLLDMLIETGAVSTEREAGYAVAFDLVSAPEKLSEEGLEGAIGVYKVVPTELVGRRAAKSEDAVSDTVAPVASTPAVESAEAPATEEDEWS